MRIVLEKKRRILGILLFVFMLNFVFAASILDELHLNLQTTDSGGNVITGTFDFVFNISTTSDCNSVIYSNSTTLTTDSRGIISYYLTDVDLNYDNQYYLCHYRDSVLINSSKISRSPYAFRAKYVNVSGIEVDSNLDLSGFNLTSDYIFGDGSGLTNLNVSSIDLSDYVPYTGANQNLVLGNNNFSVGGTDFFVDADTGRVGVGVAPSIAALTIDPNGQNAIFITENQPIRWTGGPYVGSYGGLFSLYSGTLDITFRGYNGTDVLDILYMDKDGPTGKIGIGTTTPQNTLNVLGDINATGYIYGDGSSLTNLNLSGVNGSTQWLDSGTAIYYNDGNVGIGTNDPQEQLDMRGGTSTVGTMLLGRSHATVMGSNFVLGKIQFGGEDIDSAFSNWDTASVNAIVKSSWTSATDTPTGLTFRTTPDGSGTSQERMRIDANGNVGIGTTSPASKLNINGSYDLAGGLTFNDGDSGIYENIANRLAIIVGGDVVAGFNAGGLDASVTGGAVVYTDAVASSTQVGFTFSGDTNTGMGHAGADQLSLIAGGLEIMRLSNESHVAVNGSLNATGDICSSDGCLNDVVSGSVNSNSSNYWDGLDTPSDISGSQINNDLNWINASEGVIVLGNWSADKDDYYTKLESYNQSEVDDMISSGDVNNSEMLDGYDSTFFMPLNTSVVGDFDFSGDIDFNGGWTSDGVSIIDGDIYAQAGYFYQINSLQVSTLEVNGSLIPDIDNSFDVGNSTLGWRNAYFTGAVTADSFVGNGSQLTDISFTESDPFWTGNYSAYNSSWTSTYNTTYDAYNSTGLIINWSQDLSDYATLSEILNFNYYNSTDFDIGDYYLNSNPSNYWNDTYATFNKTYADTLYNPLGIANSTAWNRSGTDVYLANSGDNVGIGTDSPIGKLDIMESNSLVPTLRMGSRETTGRQLGFVVGRNYLPAQRDVLSFWTLSDPGLNKITFGGGSSGYTGADQIDFRLATANNLNTFNTIMTMTNSLVNINQDLNVTGNVTSQIDFCIEGGDCLSDMGVGTGNVSGSGTTNYLPKFTGAAVLGNSIISESGSTIRFDSGVTEPSTLQMDNGVRVWQFVADNSPDFLGIYDGVIYRQRFTTTQTQFGGIDFVINNSNLVVDVSSGKVGINTTTPQNALNVIGDINATGYIYGDGSGLTNLNVSNINLTNYIPYTGADKNVDLGNNNFTVDTNALFVDSNTGHVGIGTSSPQNELNVIGDINATGLIYGNGSQLTGISAGLWSESGSDIYYNGGDVGIGTSIPSKNLEIYFERSSADVLSNGDQGVLIKNNDTVPNNFVNLDFEAAGAEGRIAYKQLSVDNGEFHFITEDTGGWDSRMVIQSDGDVGIGTVSPSERLEVNGTAKITGSMLIGDTNITTESNGDVQIW